MKIKLQNGQVGVPTKYVRIFEEDGEFVVRRVKDMWNVGNKLSEDDARRWANASGYVVV